MELKDFMTTRLSDAPMTDMMVDVETTGTNPANAAMIQLAAIQFNAKTGDIGPSFNRCLAIAPNRYWDESTREWWGRQNKAVFDDIVARMEDPRAVVEDFFRFACMNAPQRSPSHPGGFRFWSKPLTFDWSFVASYMTQYGLQMPFHYRIARDMNTYIAALRGTFEHVSMDHITMQGDAHNALFDCAIQIKQLLAATNNEWGEVLSG